MKRISLLVLLAAANLSPAADRPNVLLVITDDQGFGDLGAHGNPVIKTPNLDDFTKQSVWLKNFYVSPVCSPTRSSLLTGLYNYRTGIVDTSTGRSMMRPDVTTLPQMLAAAGYRTGLFGKWHLGDNYPLRPEDRGFHETLWHHGGGLAQPSDPPQVDPKSAYFDPVLTRNGKEVKTKGYCTDVFTDAAVEFITKGDAAKPFFAYVAYNAPHNPFQVPERYAAPYKKLDLTPNGFPKIGQPWAAKKLDPEGIANAYGMITNIDDNFARLLKAIDDKKQTENTIVVFLTDNGPGAVRFNAGLRNRKGTVYEGGIRVPCYVRWSQSAKGLREIDTALAHIDMTPTLAEACGVKSDVAFDGRSFLRMLTGGPGNWTSRTLFFQWHRGDAPDKFRAFAARAPRFKLVQAAGVQPNMKWEPKYELFDLLEDPFETNDLAAAKPEMVAHFKREYEAWFADVTKKGFDPPRIIIGSDKENPVRLTRQDMRGPNAGWAPEATGHWVVKIERDGDYEFTLRSRSEFAHYGIELASKTPELSRTVGGGFVATPGRPKASGRETRHILTLKPGDFQIETWVAPEEKKRGAADYLEVKYLGPPTKK